MRKCFVEQLAHHEGLQDQVFIRIDDIGSWLLDFLLQKAELLHLFVNARQAQAHQCMKQVFGEGVCSTAARGVRLGWQHNRGGQLAIQLLQFIRQVLTDVMPGFILLLGQRGEDQACHCLVIAVGKIRQGQAVELFLLQGAVNLVDDLRAVQEQPQAVFFLGMHAAGRAGFRYRCATGSAVCRQVRAAPSRSAGRCSTGNQGAFIHLQKTSQSLPVGIPFHR